MSKKSLICIIIVMLALIMFPITVKAEHERDLSIQMDIGFENKANPYRGFPVVVTINNVSDRDISGDLAFSISPSYSTEPTDFIHSVEVSAQSEVSFTVSIPSFDYTAMSGTGAGTTVKTIHFYEGGWDDGEDLLFEGKSLLTARGINDEDLVIGVLSPSIERFESLKSMKLITDHRNDVVEVKQEQIPEIGTGLNMLSVLLISDYDLNDLSEKQQRVISTWVNEGGTLLLTGDVKGIEQSVFASELPIEAFVEETDANANFFKKLTNVDYSEDVVPLQKGSPREASIVHMQTEDSEPVLVSTKSGKGEFAQLLVSPLQNDFEEWEGASEAWSQWFNPFVKNSTSFYGASEFENYEYTFTNISNLFPSSFIPIRNLVMVFAGYVLILCPLLYFILRRADKREHAWWILPSLSIILCFAIFIVGGKDRIKDHQLNENVVMRLDHTGTGYGVGSVSFLNNKKGTYSLLFKDQEFLPVPLVDNVYFNTFDGKTDTSVVHLEKEQLLTFRNREFWSISNAVGSISNVEAGNFETDLTFKNNEVEGTITNRTNFDYEAVYFMAGTEKVTLGPLKKGETNQVSFTLAGKTLFTPSNNTYPYDYEEDTSLPELVEKGLFEASFNEEVYSKGLPAIAGLSKDSILHPVLNGSQGILKVNNLIVQPIDVQSEQQGQLSLDNKDLMPSGYSFTGDIYFEEEVSLGERTIYAENGQYELMFSVPTDLMEDTFVFNEMSLSTLNEEETIVQLYNVKEELYEDITGRVTFEDPSLYLDEWGDIQIRINKNDSKDTLTIPQINLKGEFKND
ncbi:hypothetical protein [Alkalicoccobacillus gibsonii]|uniref:hypothetical protein n=1 Tax=Alkalicoccobacillus gibsonii TaxID=79881 RepID=UPI00351849EE